MDPQTAKQAQRLNVITDMEQKIAHMRTSLDNWDPHLDNKAELTRKTALLTGLMNHITAVERKVADLRAGVEGRLNDTAELERQSAHLPGLVNHITVMERNATDMKRYATLMERNAADLGAGVEGRIVSPNPITVDHTAGRSSTRSGLMYQPSFLGPTTINETAGTHSQQIPQAGSEVPQASSEVPQAGIEAPQAGTEAPQAGIEAPQASTEHRRQPMRYLWLEYLDYIRDNDHWLKKAPYNPSQAFNWSNVDDRIFYEDMVREQDRLWYENMGQQLQEFNRNAPDPHSRTFSTAPEEAGFLEDGYPSLWYENMGQQLQESNRNAPDPHSRTFSTAPEEAGSQEDGYPSPIPQSSSPIPSITTTSPSPIPQPSYPIPSINITPASPEAVAPCDRDWLPPANLSRQNLMIPSSRRRRTRWQDEENVDLNDGFCHDRRCRISRRHPTGIYVHSGHQPEVRDEYFGFSEPPPRIRRMMIRLIEHTNTPNDLRIVADFLHIHGGEAAMDEYGLNDLDEEDDEDETMFEG